MRVTAMSVSVHVPMIMVVVIVVMMVTRVPRPQRLRAPIQQIRPDHHNRQSRNRTQHRENLFRNNLRFKEQHAQSEREYARRMRERHQPTQQQCVLHSSTAANQIRRDDRLAVTRRQRVHRAQPERDTQADQQHRRRDLAAAQQSRKIVPFHHGPVRSAGPRIARDGGRRLR